MDAAFRQPGLENVREVVLVGDLLLLPAGLLFSYALWRRRRQIADEFIASWKIIFLATLVMNLGFLLNLLTHVPEITGWRIFGPTPLSSALEYGAYISGITLFFHGVRQWYPLILSVQQDAMAQASLYRKLVQEANSIFLRWGRDGRILSINPYGEKLFGYSEEELRGRSVIGTLVRERDSGGRDLAAMIEAIRRNPDEFHINENENVTREGHRLWIGWRNTYIEEGLDGKPELLSVGVDITDRKRFEDALHVLASTTDPLPGDSNVLERTIKHLALAYGVKYAFYGTFTDDSQERVEIQAMWDGQSITRGHVYALEGTPCSDVVQGRVNLIREGVAERYPNDSALREWGIESYFGSRLKGLQNEVIGLIVIMDTRPLELPSWKRSLLRVFAARIGGELQRRRAEEDIYRLAHYDILTGLPNRLLFHDRLEQAMVHAQRNDQCLALLFIDLDRFKHVNDTLGHAGGDLLLREVAGRLTALLRRSDTVARLGGDEFTILMTDFHSESAMLKVVTGLSHRIIEVLGEPFLIDNVEMFISASVGITCFPADGVNIDYLVRNADLAMYKAKEQGRNCFEFYRPEFNEVAERRNRMEMELRAAIAAGEMQLHYQPIIDIDSGKVVGLEGLVRWRHPSQGLVLPDDFVGLAEESGLILPLGEWVIDVACRQLGTWCRAGLEVDWLSINLSLRQLTGGNLLETLEAARKRYGVAAGQLVLEITETTFMQEPENTLPLLQKFREHGYRMAMDDFGTGYSSFGQLRKLPVSSLKIDRSFLEGLEEDAAKVSIVAAIIGMGHGLGLEVVAEGVETPGQLQVLREQGCRFMQGHHFASPMGADDCAAYLASHHPWQGRLPAL